MSCPGAEDRPGGKCSSKEGSKRSKDSKCIYLASPGLQLGEGDRMPETLNPDTCRVPLSKALSCPCLPAAIKQSRPNVADQPPTGSTSCPPTHLQCSCWPTVSCCMAHIGPCHGCWLTGCCLQHCLLGFLLNQLLLLLHQQQPLLELLSTCSSTTGARNRAAGLVSRQGRQWHLAVVAQLDGEQANRSSSTPSSSFFDAMLQHNHCK